MRTFKLFSRLATGIGMILAFAITGWGANIDLSLTKTAPATVSLGASLAYTLIAKNNTGNKNASTVSIVDTLPLGVQYSSRTGNNWTCSATAYNAAVQQVVTCSLGTLNSNTTAQTLTINTTAPSVVGDINNTATVSQVGDTETTPANNTASAVTTVQVDYTINNPRNFDIIYQTNTYGDIKIIGNSVLCQDNGSGQCAATVDTALNNNDINTLFYKLASDSADANITNSTSYTFSLPAGVSKSDVLWAGLYWQAGLKGTPSVADMNASQTVKLKAPGDTVYRNIQAETTNGTHTNRFNWMINTTMTTAMYYQGVKDITSIVQSAGAGTYQVANIKATYGTAYSPGHYGGWAIVIAYHDANATLKNLTVYDGFNAVNSSNTVDANLTGFLTPSSGTIDSKFMIFGGEGDLNYQRDQIYITNKTGTPYYLKSDGTASTTSGSYNPMHSSITLTGSDTRVPSYTNNIGIDILTYNVGTSVGGLGIIGNGQTSTRINLSTGDDVYNPGVFAFSTQIYAPNLQITKTPSTASGSTLTPGAQIDYTASFTNTGKEVAKQITVFDDFTQNLLMKKDGNVTSPAVYLSDLLDRNATKMKQSIRLSDANSTTTWHCAQGLSGISGCTVYDANCSVDYTGAVGTTATKAWCYLPTVGINTTYTMKFSVNIATNPDTKNQAVVVENQMFASYKDNVTGASMPNAASNVANAGYYGSVVAYTPGNIDVVDNYLVNGYLAGTGLKTKVASKTGTTQDAIWLGTSGTPQPYCSTCTLHYPMPITMTLSDNSCSNDENLSTSDPIYMTLAQNATYVRSASFQMTPRAKQVGKVKIRFIDWSTLLPSLSGAPNNCVSQSNFNANLNGVPQCFNSQSVINSTFPAATYPNVTICTTVQAGGSAAACDPSAYNNSGVKTAANIMPAKYNNDYGCLMCLADAVNSASTCSTDTFAIRPNLLLVGSTSNHWPDLLTSGQDYNTTIQAPDAIGNLTLDYNVTSARSVFELNTTARYYPSGALDANGSLAGVYTMGANDFNMSNGISVRSDTVSHEVAPINFTDVGKMGLRVMDKIWAAVDNDDTTLDCSGTYICGDVNATFIPFDFNISTATVTNNNGYPGTFTYVIRQGDPITALQAMSGRFQLNISALNKNNAITQNFRSGAWENPLSATASVFDTLRGDANETSIANVLLGFGTGADAYGTKTLNWNESNTSKMLRFNFNMSPNVPIDPFRVDGNETNITVSSHYTGAAAIAARDITGARLQNADGNATFVYGRIIPKDIRVFGSVTPIANAWYEVYNAPSIAGFTLAPSKNENLWYSNTLHNDTTDGDANVTRVVQGVTITATNYSSPSLGNGIETYTFPIVNAAAIPYSAKAHIDTDSWLWYGVNAAGYSDPSNANLDCLTHPCFNINVVPAVGATGSANTAVKNTKSNKASSSGGGAWHSTSDYAPAIR